MTPLAAEAGRVVFVAGFWRRVLAGSIDLICLSPALFAVGWLSVRVTGLKIPATALLRPETTLEGLAALRPVFSATGSVTAGNSSPLSDGAAAALLTSEAKAKELGVKPLGYFRAFVTVGVDPAIMGIGPLPAVQKLLKKTGMTLDQIDLIEMNEAFASQAVYCKKELGIPDAKLNVNGGAIALGHPLGCTGAKLTATVLHELRKRGGRYGIVTMCVGGGQGAAGLFELAR